MTNKRVAETGALEEEFTKLFTACLMSDYVRGGGAMSAMKLKRRGSTWPTAREAGQLSEPTFKGTVLSLIHI